MGKNTLNILHIDTESEWRGGQQQVIYLLQGLLKNKITTALVCQPSSRLADFCRAQNLPFYPIRMRGELDLLATYKVARIARQNKSNILHLHSAHAVSIGLLAKLFYPSPKLVGVRRVDFHIRRHIFSRLKYTSRLMDRIVCISEGIKNVLIEDGIPPERIAMIRSGIDINKFNDSGGDVNIRERFKIPEDHILIGTVAAMVGHKDYPTLLRAASLVIQQVPEVTFLAVGEGNDFDSIKRLSQQLELGERFIFAGFQQHVGAFLKSFDIFVMASKTEGLGTSILDAQSVGLPVIAARTGGIPEIVQHEQNGLLVPPEDPRAMADALIELINDKSKRISLGKKAKENVRNYSIDMTIADTIRLYEELLNGEGAGK